MSLGLDEDCKEKDKVQNFQSKNSSKVREKIELVVGDKECDKRSEIESIDHDFLVNNPKLEKKEYDESGKMLDVSFNTQMRNGYVMDGDVNIFQRICGDTPVTSDELINRPPKWVVNIFQR